MILSLKYGIEENGTVSAFFVRGNTAVGWLKTISQSGVYVSDIECYPMPESIHSEKIAGLFVVIKSKGEKRENFFNPYILVADTLFIPSNSTLFPPVYDNELKSKLLYDVNVFHPSIGLVGFDTSNQVSLADLLLTDQALPTNWAIANKGISKKPGLKQIQMTQPSLEEVMESFKKEIETKPIQDLLTDQEKNKSPDLSIDAVKRRLLKSSISFLKALRNKKSDNDKKSDAEDNGSETSSPAEEDNPGFLDRVENWIEQNLDAIEKRRNDEINKLLDMFDKDMNEALKYAIPLDSPYLNRGTASPTSDLTKRNTNFDLSNLGGGSAVDGWDIGDSYFELRAKYQKAAQKEIENKDFKKAAYIYANLLGDFHSAARVLMQGQYYREAAIIYKDHLKNLSAAADCFEKGGYYLEAIELYQRLSTHRFEKIGDLYKKIDQQEEAGLYFERSIEVALRNSDYLEASRIMKDKLDDSGRALDNLLDGWRNSVKGEVFLKKYLDEIIAADAEKASTVIEEIRANHTPNYKKLNFLNVLSELKLNQIDKETEELTRKIAFEIVSESAKEGNVSALGLLNKFVPDRLLGSDISRFVSRRRERPTSPKSNLFIHPDKEIRWLSAISYRTQFLAIGLKNNNLILTRGNWAGHFEYYSWEESFSVKTTFKLIADAYLGSDVLLYNSAAIGLNDKKLVRNSYFSEDLNIKCPAWISSFSAVSFTTNGIMGALKVQDNGLAVQNFNSKLEMIGEIACNAKDKTVLLLDSKKQLSDMYFQNNSYFTFRNNFVVKISASGETAIFDLNSPIKILAVSPYLNQTLLAVATSERCYLLTSSYRKLEALQVHFASEYENVDLKFVSPTVLVAASRYQAKVYSFEENKLKDLKIINITNSIISILVTSKRNQFTLLCENGELLIYEL